MKGMLSKEHYCCKINKLFINEKQCFPSSFMVFKNPQLPWDGEGSIHTVNDVQMT